MIVAERFELRRSPVLPGLPQRGDVGFREVSGDIVEDRGGASASAGGNDDLHGRGSKRPIGPLEIEYNVALGVMQGVY